MSYGLPAILATAGTVITLALGVTEVILSRRQAKIESSAHATMVDGVLDLEREEPTLSGEGWPARTLVLMAIIVPALALAVVLVGSMTRQPPDWLHLRGPFGTTSLLAFGTVYGGTAILSFAFAAWAIPWQIGAGELAFQRQANASNWVFGIGCVALLSATTAELFFDSYRSILVALSIAVLCMAAFSIHFAIRLIVSILNTRAPGMTLAKMPLNCWAWLVAAYVMLAANSLAVGYLGILLINPPSAIPVVTQWRGLLRLSIGAFLLVSLLTATGAVGPIFYRATKGNHWRYWSSLMFIVAIAGICVWLLLSLWLAQLLGFNGSIVTSLVSGSSGSLALLMVIFCVMCAAAVRPSNPSAIFAATAFALYAIGLAAVARSANVGVLGYFFVFASAFALWASGYDWLSRLIDAPPNHSVAWIHFLLSSLLSAPGLLNEAAYFTPLNILDWAPETRLVLRLFSIAGLGLIQIGFAIYVLAPSNRSHRTAPAAGPFDQAGVNLLHS
ncbi:hypothetical protein [Variovorax ginsengisoli]|uniref:Cytochrome oxidase subunit I profile domain-containing protein n=1 Tax=Variovorax ginsengisoli TaxID=363844 RepID=A0ABT8S9Z4_9BURK|nr:hypothetical protein [Variovorax ginsengisoli]MDN8616420.1 hypothetical protein [Variovorax ginsengisoli]MDO1535590.1 hypothetical protein [Variovorax ginsengisoli]